jgi:hypothetical protein
MLPSTPAFRWLSLLIFLFVLGTAIATRNPGLFILAGLCAAGAAATWLRRGSGG